MVLDLLLIFVLDTPLPRLWDLFDDAPGDRWQGGGNVVLDIKPMQMPPLVGGRQSHRRVLADPVVLEVDAGASHRCIQLLLLLSLLLEGDGEEVPPQIKVGTDPQESLTQGDERHNVLDSIGIKMLQLHLVVVQQSPKKLMGRGGESPLVEVSEGHDVSLRR